MFPCKITKARVSRLQPHKQMGVWLRLSRITGINNWSCGKPSQDQALPKLSRTRLDWTTITPCTTPSTSQGEFDGLHTPLSRPQMINMATRCQQQSTGQGHLSHIFIPGYSLSHFWKTSASRPAFSLRTSKHQHRIPPSTTF